MSEMLFAPVGPRLFYLVTWDGLFQSSDSGRILTLVEGLPGGADGASVYSLAFAHDVGLDGQQRLVMYVGAAGGYRSNPGFCNKMNRSPQTELMSPGVYRRVVAVHHIYLPLVRR